MIAIAIITIGIFGVMSLVITVMKGNTLSKRVTTATTIAQDKMEDFKRMDYDNVDVAVDAYSSTDTTYDIDYYRKVTVEDDKPATDTKTIMVDVYWDPPASSSAHKVEIKTIIAQ
jgi:Tfp pilus assembly protein PilV